MLGFQAASLLKRGTSRMSMLTGHFGFIQKGHNPDLINWLLRQIIACILRSLVIRKWRRRRKWRRLTFWTNCNRAENGDGRRQFRRSGRRRTWWERYVAKYAAKEDTKVNRSLSGRVMLNWPSLQSFPARDKKSIHDGGRGKWARRGARGGQTARREADERVLRER